MTIPKPCLNTFFRHLGQALKVQHLVGVFIPGFLIVDFVFYSIMYILIYFIIFNLILMKLEIKIRIKILKV